MIRAELATAARWVRGELIGSDAVFTGVSSDSRNVQPGALFIALRGERFDAHDFVAEAAARGASAALVDHRLADPSIRQIVVADTTAALAELARNWRAQLTLTAIGVTGSNGKTTTKSLLAHVLRAAGATQASHGNLNNEIGLPLSILALDRDTRFAVLEMGCGKPGDIAHLAAIGQPDVALVTNVGPAHLERLGSLENVAKTKAELYAALPAGGIAVVNADEPFAAYFRALLGARTIIEFGLDAGAAVSATIAEVGMTSRFELRVPGSSAWVDLPLPGRHNIANALSAAAAAYALGLDAPTIAAGLAAAPSVSGRLNAIEINGALLIDDSYNANPASVRAAIDVLALTPGESWLVLGDMRELGEDQARLHAEIGDYARTHGVRRLLALGPLAAHAAAAFGADAQVFADHAAIAAQLQAALKPGLKVLVKGSRSSAMERVISALRAPTAPGGHADAV